jgi:hypothetical protein
MELIRGTMVRHDLIAYRDDCAAASQPITFAGERCESYVPIALPWTARIRERLPRGTAAVLINRAHPFSDLAIPIDAFEDRLLANVDGTRTIAEILSIAAVADSNRPRALTFFERLWQYDQVVFDASGCL